MHKKTLLTLLAILATAITMVASPSALAAVDPFAIPCDRLSKSQKDTAQACNQDGTTNPISGSDGVIMNITTAIAVVAGIVAVIIIIIAGFQFVLSGGDETKAANARKSILYAVAGIIFVVIAQSVVTIVINKTL